MSASLIALIPLVLLGLVGTLCFVGCGYPDFQFGTPYESTILATPNVVAYWPLDDDKGSAIAADIAPKQAPLTAFNGKYTGSVEPGQTAIVPKDQEGSAFFNGGFVNVDFHQELNTSSFTVEAWVQPGWVSTDAPAIRGVVVSTNTPAGAGYAMIANVDNATMQNFWAAQVGTGSGNFQQVQADQPITLSTTNTATNTTFLAMTFDALSQALTLYVGLADMPLSQKAISLGSLMPPATFLAEQGKPPMSTATPLFIGSGRPDLPGGMFPFDGFIQDVAYYSSALTFETLKQHFQAGTNAGG